MEYKILNSTSLKSLQLSEDTNIIFELNKANNNKVYIQKHLYTSKYVCPISFSIIHNINSTSNIGFGIGNKLDFMYEVTYVSNSLIKLKHPTGEEEEFNKTFVKTNEENNQVYYYYSSITKNYIKRIGQGSITSLIYYGDSFIGLFEYKGNTPLNLYKYSRNGNTTKGWVTVEYDMTNILKRLFNDAPETEQVDFTYENKYIQFVVTKKFDKNTKTEVNKVNLTYLNNQLTEIKEMKYGKTNAIRHTKYTYLDQFFSVKNEISTIQTTVVFSMGAVHSIQRNSDVMEIEYVDDYQTNIYTNGMWEKYFFDKNNNLQHIENGLGIVKSFNYDNTPRRLLLNESKNVYAKAGENTKKCVSSSQKVVISNNGYDIENVIDNSCPMGNDVTRVSLCETYEDEESEFTFRFYKKGCKFDVENISLWYKVNGSTNTSSTGEINVYLYFNKISSPSSTLIKCENLKINTTIKNKWLFSILTGQAAEDYDYVDVYFSPSNQNCVVDFNIELLTGSFSNIYKYDSLGRVIEVLNETNIEKYTYNEDSYVINSSSCQVEYDEFGKPVVISYSNNMKQEIVRDSFSNTISNKVFSKDQTKYTHFTKGYVDNEHLTTENTTQNNNIAYLYDDKKRLTSISCQGYKVNEFFSENDDNNYGKINKIMHSYNHINSYINMDGSQFAYNDRGGISEIKHLNLASAPDYTYTYTYDNQNRLTSVSLGNKVLVEYFYNVVNNCKIFTQRINNENVSFNYDENERIISIEDDYGLLYEYTYDDETTRVKKIRNSLTNEEFLYEYEGSQVSKVISGTFVAETELIGDNVIIEKKTNNNSVVSVEKSTVSIADTNIDTYQTFIDDVYKNEGSNVYLATFTEKNINEGDFSGELSNTDVPKTLMNKNGDKFIENGLTYYPNNDYEYDGLPCINFSDNRIPLVYYFNGEKSLKTKYSLFFGFKLEQTDATNEKPLIYIYNGSASLYDHISLFVENDKIRIRFLDFKRKVCRNEYVNIKNGVGKLNFIATNITCERVSQDAYLYTMEVYFNGYFVGKIENYELSNDMNNLILMSDNNSESKSGKVYSLFVKTDDHISVTNIEKYTNTLFKAYRNNNRSNKLNFNKKLRLFNTNLPIVCFDNTFNSIVGNIKPFKTIFGDYIETKSDCFCSDSDTGENVLLLKSQVLAYDFNLNYSGIVGLRFKRIDGVATNIMSLDNGKLKINVETDQYGNITTTINSIAFTNFTIDNSWNNVFIKWERIVSSNSLDESFYKVFMYINGSLSHLGEYSIVGEMPNMILYIGKHYLDNSKELGCLGYVEKVVGCEESTSLSLLDSLFDNLGEGVINRYDDFNQRVNKEVFTRSSKNITHLYTNEVSASGRVIGMLLEESISFNGSPFSTKYYAYNLDKTLKSLRIHDNLSNITINESFVYDEKKQLVEFSDGNNTYKYTYDNMGNITQILKNDIETLSATYIDGILINSENNYIINYDSNGYPISKKSGETVLENYTWKCGRLESVEYGLQQRKIVFSYNANGQRTSKKDYFGTSLTNTTRYYYSTSGFLVYETRTLNDVKLEYLYDSEGSLYGVYYNGTPYYYVRDALGTITHIVDSNLNVVTRLEYDGAYGKHNVNDLTSTGSNHISFVNPFRYKGYYYDVETQLYWVSSRYYSPELCRWISPDSIEYLDPESINGLNLYAYCGNDPINNYDPTGHFSLPNWAKWVIGGVAFAGAVALTIISGGSLAPVFIGMGVSIASSALIEGAISAYNGEGFWSGFADGAADGAMWGGIFALASSTVSFVKNLGLIKSRGVVIGKGMDRVGFVADQAALSKYSPMKGYNLIRGSGKSTWRVNLADKLSVAHNKAWINRVMRLKKPIYDIGLGGIREAGAWYGMELLEVANYFNYFLF